jgi:hypothetical protein
MLVSKLVHKLLAKLGSKLAKKLAANLTSKLGSNLNQNLSLNLNLNLNLNLDRNPILNQPPEQSLPRPLHGRIVVRHAAYTTCCGSPGLPDACLDHPKLPFA